MAASRDRNSSKWREVRRRHWLRRALKYGIILSILAGIIGWSAWATWPDVRAGDMVEVRYAFRTAAGDIIEGSDAAVVYVDPVTVPRAFHKDLCVAKIGIERSLTIPACPSHACEDYGGFVSGSHAYEEIRVTFTVLAILSHGS